MHNILIIFDIDGTLTDSVTPHQSSFNDALDRLGLIKDEAFSSYKHHTDRYIFREIFYQNHNRYPVEHEMEEFYNLLTSLFEQKQIKEIEGATLFIDKLNSSNIPYVFATGSVLQPALKKLSVVKVNTPEPTLSTSDDTDSRDAIVRSAINRAYDYYNQDEYDDMVIIGDGKWDYITAVNLGISFLGIGDNALLKETLGDNAEKIWKSFANYVPQDIANSLIKNG